MGKLRYPKGIYVTACVVITLIATIVTMNNSGTAPDVYHELWILPAGHLLFSTFLMWRLLSGEVFLDIPTLIITATYTMRNAVTPMIMATGGYWSRLGYPSSGHDTDVAIAIFLYETLAVYVYLLLKKRNRKIKHYRLVNGAPNKSQTIYIALLIAGTAISIGAFIVLPELKTQYYTIFHNDITHIVHEEVQYTTGIKRALSTACNMIIEGTRLALFSFLIVTLRKHGEKFFNYLISIVLVGVQLLFMNDSNAYIIMLMLALFMLIYRLYPRYRKGTIGFLIFGVVFFLVLMNINRFSLNGYRGFSSVFLQAYFPGLGNFCGVFRLMDRNVMDVIKQFFIDLYAAVPFRSTLFGYSGNLVALPTLWNQANKVSGQIMPNVAQSYYYFGAILSPLLSVFLAHIATKFFDRVKNAKSPYLYTLWIYLTIYFAASLAMYDFYIAIKMLLQRALFMLIFTYWSTTTFDEVLGEINDYS